MKSQFADWEKIQMIDGQRGRQIHDTYSQFSLFAIVKFYEIMKLTNTAVPNYNYYITITITNIQL